MKKMIIILLCFVFIFPHTSININALENNEIEYLDNGYYIITTINEETVLKSTKTKTGTKTKKFYNSNNQVIWSVSVHGTLHIQATVVSVLPLPYLQLVQEVRGKLYLLMLQKVETRQSQMLLQGNI